MIVPSFHRRIVAGALFALGGPGLAFGQTASSSPSVSSAAANFFSGQAEHAAPPSPRAQLARTTTAAAPTSIFGSTPPPTTRLRPSVPAPTVAPATSPPSRLGAPPTLQSGGLPIYGLARRTDATPVCRGACASQYYVCGAGSECAATRGACLQQCAAPRTEWGRFGVAPQ